LQHLGRGGESRIDKVEVEIWHRVERNNEGAVLDMADQDGRVWEVGVIADRDRPASMIVLVTSKPASWAMC
jgi:hypothetical protein